LVIIPVIVDANRLAISAPLHARSNHPVFHRLATIRFGYAGGDGPGFGDVLDEVYEVGVLREITIAGDDLLPSAGESRRAR